MQMNKSKFIFSEDFEKPECDPADEVKFTEKDMSVVKKKAFDEGIEAGKSLEKKGIDAQLIQALIGFQDHLSRFVDEEGNKRREIQYQAAQLAKNIAVKICISESETNAVDRVLSCMDSATKNLLGTPKITVRVNPEIESPLSKRVHEMIQGDLIQVIADESIAKMDCQLVWANGGAESILENTLKEVDLILEESVGLKSQIKPIEGEEK